MGCCCSSDEQVKRSSKTDIFLGDTRKRSGRNIVDSRPELPSDLNDWTQEDCDAYVKDEALFEDDLEFSKGEIVVDFHRELNLFMSMLRQKAEENNKREIHDHRDDTENKSDVEKNDQDQCDGEEKHNNPVAAPSPSRNYRHFHINTKESSMEEKLVDVAKIQKVFCIAVAFGRFSDARTIYQHYDENVKSGNYEDDAVAIEINNNNNNPLTAIDTEQETSSKTETNKHIKISKKPQPDFDINAPLKPFFPYNSKVHQWNPLQWCIAIHTQRHLNEHFHEKSERLDFLKKERGDFVVHETSREEQNKAVAQFVDFLINSCGADVNCDETRRSYEKMGRLVPFPAHAVASLAAQEQKERDKQKLKKAEKQEKSKQNALTFNPALSARQSSTTSEPFSPQTFHSADDGGENENNKNKMMTDPSVGGTVISTAELYQQDLAQGTSADSKINTEKKSTTNDPRLNLQHDEQDYCHRDHPLFLAVEANNDLAISLLTSVRHCVINPLNKNKDTPLAHFCDTFRIYNSHSLERGLNIVKCLLDHCADVNHENLDDTKTNFTSVKTALDFAVIHGHVEIARMLIEQGNAEWTKTFGKLTSLLEEYLKWNYGTRENALKMRKYFKELAVKNAMTSFAGEVADGKISGSDVPASLKRNERKRGMSKTSNREQQSSKELASP